MSSVRSRRGERLRAVQFCAERGYTFRDRSLNPPLSGLLFRNSKNVALHDVVDARGTSNSFIYARVFARGRRLRGLKVVMLPLPRPVPNMVLVSTDGSVLKKLGIALKESQQLSVEGDFARLFTLYCPSGYESDALYVFTPDLLARLMDAAAGCDLEIVDDRVLIYAPPTAFSDSGQLAKLPRLVDFLHEKFERQTRLYLDDRRNESASRDPFLRAQLTSGPAADEAHSVGRMRRRLRTRTTGLQKAGIALALILALSAAAYWLSMVALALFSAG